MTSAIILKWSLASWTVGVGRLQIVMSILGLLAGLALEIDILILIIQSKVTHFTPRMFYSIVLLLVMVHFAIGIYFGFYLLRAQRERNVRKLKCWLWYRGVIAFIAGGLSIFGIYMTIQYVAWWVVALMISSMLYDLIVVCIILVCLFRFLHKRINIQTTAFV